MKVTNIEDPGDNLRAGPAWRVREATGDEADPISGGRVFKVHAIAEGERPIMGGQPIPVTLVDMPESGLVGGKIQPVYFVSGGPVGGSPPAAPSLLSATAVSSTQINLAWVDNSGDETGFNIYRDAVLVDTVAANETTYQDTGLGPATEYDYYVTAVNAAGSSGHSNTAVVSTLDSNYFTYEGAMVVSPSPAWRSAANQLFISIKAALGVANIADGLDFMYVLAAETEQVGLLNAVNPGTHNATNVNNMAFQASRGFTGNGSSSYLNTNYAPITNGINYQQNSASFGLYCRTDSNDAANAVTDAGSQSVSSRSVSIRLRTLNFVIGSVNSQTGGMLIANADSRSLFVVNRSGANAQRVYRAGVSLVLDGDSSSALPVNNIFIGAFNNNGVAAFFSNRQLSFSFAGRSMDATEQLDFYTAVQTFMTAIGAQV